MTDDIDGIAIDLGNIYLNALPVVLSNREIPTIEIESDKTFYSSHIKPILERAIDITYWTPHPPPNENKYYISYVTSVNSPIDQVKTRLQGVKDHINFKGETYIELDNKNIKLVERAIMKRFIEKGWKCSKKYGNIVCISTTPFHTKPLFTFSRAIEFRVTYLGHPLLILRPHVKIGAPTLKELFNMFGDEISQKVINLECIALHRFDNRFRKGTIVEIRKESKEDCTARIVFFDGLEDEVDIKNVKLMDNINSYKKFIIDLFGEQVFKQLENTQREFSFSLGPKESSLSLGVKFKNEVFNIIRNSGIFPFKLGDVNIDVNMELFEVTRYNELWDYTDTKKKIRRW